MKPYFSTPERIAALDAEARSWLNTPFAAKAMVKGAGVDCIHLVAGIYLAIGALHEFDPGQYTLDEGSHLKASKVTAWFDAHPDFIQVAAPYQPGDVLCFNFALVGHHIGMLIVNGGIIHAADRRKVALADQRESLYMRRIVQAYRFTEAS